MIIIIIVVIIHQKYAGIFQENTVHETLFIIETYKKVKGNYLQNTRTWKSPSQKIAKYFPRKKDCMKYTEC